MATVTQEYDFGVPAKRRRSRSGYGAPGSTYIPRGAKYVAPYARYRKKVPKAVRTYVRSAISRSLESKRAFVNASNVNIFALINSARCFSCVPAISQGTTQGARIGNSITLKSLQIRYQLMANLSTNPAFYVDIYVFRRKPNAVLTSIDTNFLQAGNTSIGYDSDTFPYVGMLSVNEDLYEQCLHKRVKIWNPNNTANTGVQASIDPCYSGILDVTRFMKKKITYNDGTPTPTNEDVFFTVGCTYVNGVSTGGLALGTMTYVMESEYIDA